MDRNVVAVTVEETSHVQPTQLKHEDAHELHVNDKEGSNNNNAKAPCPNTLMPFQR